MLLQRVTGTLQVNARFYVLSERQTSCTTNVVQRIKCQLSTVKQSAILVPVGGGARPRWKLDSDNAAVDGACSDGDIQTAVDRTRSDVWRSSGTSQQLRHGAPTATTCWRLQLDRRLLFNTTQPPVPAQFLRHFLGENLLMGNQPLLRNGPQKLPNSAKERKITAIAPFKVIQGHRFWNQSKAHFTTSHLAPFPRYGWWSNFR